MFRTLYALLLITTLTSISHAQTQVKVQLEDGSVIRCVALAESIQVDTAYGTLTIPIAEVKRIQFGIHATPLEAKQIADARRGLESGVFKDREVSRKTLAAMGRLAVPVLRAAVKSSDREVSVNASLLLQAIAEGDPREVRELDSIQASFPIEGKIKAESLSFRSALGESAIPLGKIESLTVQRADIAISVLAPKADSIWTATGITLERGDSLTVKASGTVELYPQDPGKWMATPKGNNTAGKGGQFLAGALLGKIGNGQPFVIGDFASIHVQEAGELQLQIVASPWNNASDGSYSVQFKIGR